MKRTIFLAVVFFLSLNGQAQQFSGPVFNGFGQCNALCVDTARGFVYWGNGGAIMVSNFNLDIVTKVTITKPCQVINDMALIGDYLLVAGSRTFYREPQNLYILRLPELEMVKVEENCGVLYLSANENFVCLGCGANGFAVMGIDEILHPQFQETLLYKSQKNQYSWAQNAIFYNSHCYVAMGGGGMADYNLVTDVTTYLPVTGDEFFVDIEEVGGMLYAATEDGGVVAINPGTHIRGKRWLKFGYWTRPWNIETDGTHLYISGINLTLCVLDLNLNEICFVGGGDIYDMDISDNNIFLAAHYSGTQLWHFDSGLKLQKKWDATEFISWVHPFPNNDGFFIRDYAGSAIIPVVDGLQQLPPVAHSCGDAKVAIIKNLLYSHNYDHRLDRDVLKVTDIFDITSTMVVDSLVSQSDEFWHGLAANEKYVGIATETGKFYLLDRLTLTPVNVDSLPISQSGNFFNVALVESFLAVNSKFDGFWVIGKSGRATEHEMPQGSVYSDGNLLYVTSLDSLRWFKINSDGEPYREGSLPNEAKAMAFSDDVIYASFGSKIVAYNKEMEELAHTDIGVGINYLAVCSGTADTIYASIGYYGVGRLEFNRGSTFVSIEEPVVPTGIHLGQNYPNPFNPKTSISFSLKQAGKVTLRIYNSNGQVVKTLVDHEMSAGNHNISFVADGLASGLYIYRIMVTNGEGVQFQAVRKMILMK